MKFFSGVEKTLLKSSHLTAVQLTVSSILHQLQPDTAIQYHGMTTIRNAILVRTYGVTKLYIDQKSCDVMDVEIAHSLQSCSIISVSAVRGTTRIKIK